MALAERINHALTLKKASQADLMRACQVKSSSVTAWLDGTTKQLRGNNLINAAKFLDVSISWLSTGQGQMQMVDSIGLPDSASEIDFSIPLLSWARAGAFCEAAGQFTFEDAEELLPRPWPSMGKNVFATTVRGDSMDAPGGYPEGEIIYLNPDIRPTSGKDVLARTDDGFTFKRYKEDESGPYLLQLNGNKIIRPEKPWSVCAVVEFS